MPETRLDVDAEAGTFSLSTAEGMALAPAWTEVELSDGRVLSTRDGGFDLAGEAAVEDGFGVGRAVTLRRRGGEGEPEVEMTVALYEDEPFVVLRSRLENTTGEPLNVRAFPVLRGRLPEGEWRFHKQGWQSWSPTLTLPPGERDVPPFAPVIDLMGAAPADGALVSDLVAALADAATGRAATAGFVTAADQFSQVVFEPGTRALTATSYADGIAVAPGEGLSSERGVVDITRAPLRALPAFGEALAREMVAVRWPHVPGGWCSWYQYFTEVTEDDIIANLERLVEMRGEAPLEYVQVDDGYQAGIGDWLTVNGKFPRGMAWLAEEIHRRGFKAGLWLAPFLAGAESRLFAEHPGWLVWRADGAPAVALQNWGQLCYALDCTRPEVIEWVERVFRTVTDEWGYDYVKIDFVYAAAIEGVRADANVTRAQAYRWGLQAVRRAVGERFVLGCGAPLGPSVGLANGMRIGPDVAPQWRPAVAGVSKRASGSFPSAFNALRNTVTRWWTHDRLWLNDPDCLLLRDTQTQLTDDEVRTLATVMAVSGGMVLDSDDLSLVSPARREVLARALSLRGPAAVPLDLMERETPRLLWREEDGLLAVVNWSDGPEEIEAPLPLAAKVARDFWTGEDVPLNGGRVWLLLPAHGSRLLALRPV